MTEPKGPPNWWQLMKERFPWRQFGLGALVPITIFYTLQRLDRPLTGALLAAGWGLAVALITYWRSRQINLFAGLAVPFALIELLGTLITRSPSFFLAAAAIDHTIWGIVFLGSLLLPRSLIQIFAETMGGASEAKAFIPERPYQAAWQILTVFWGTSNLLTALALIAAQLWLSLEAFLIVRTLSGTPLFVIMMAVSFWFPGWYWKRTVFEAEEKESLSEI